MSVFCIYVNMIKDNLTKNKYMTVLCFSSEMAEEMVKTYFEGLGYESISIVKTYKLDTSNFIISSEPFRKFRSEFYEDYFKLHINRSDE